jgi:phospholipid/cholesterol/gamma-HCH transport system substrate-binding protein
MRDTWKSARVGLLVVLGGLATFAVYRYVDEQDSAGDGYMVYALFDDAQGLIPRSRVVIAGIPVGTIKVIKLQGEQARVEMNIDADVELHEDAAVAMRAVSLLGEKILAIHPGSQEKPLLHDGDRIRVVQEAVGTDQVLHTVGEIAESVKAVTTQLERAFGTDEAGQRMEHALQNLSESLEVINRTLATNEQVINDILGNIDMATEEGAPRFIRILDNVESATRDVQELLAHNRGDLDQGIGEVDDTIASIHRASEELEGVLADVREVSGRTARGEGTIGRLTTDETLIDEVEGIAEGVGDLVGGIARLRTIVELRSEYNFLANTFKTYFSLRLEPREGRYFLLQVVDDPRGTDEVTETFVRRSPPIPGEPGTYQETRITRSTALRFTVMLAKRVGFATFRFGIMESSGGLGLDLNFFDDRLEINSDVFDFGQQGFPRWRTRIGFEVLSRFWVVAGVDDVINDDRDVFLGLMLRFDDEDLKGLLPFAGGLRP